MNKFYMMTCKLSKSVCFNSFLILFSILTIFSGYGCSEENTENNIGSTIKSLYDGKLEIQIPSDFTVMTERGVAMKYPNAEKPDIVYTSDSGFVNVLITLKNRPTTSNDLPAMKASFDKQLSTAYTEDYKSAIQMINGSQYVVYEFVSSAGKAPSYNLMFTTDLDGKFLLGTINCPLDIADNWRPKMKEILSSLKKSSNNL